MSILSFGFLINWYWKKKSRKKAEVKNILLSLHAVDVNANSDFWSVVKLSVTINCLYGRPAYLCGEQSTAENANYFLVQCTMGCVKQITQWHFQTVQRPYPSGEPEDPLQIGRSQNVPANDWLFEARSIFFHPVKCCRSRQVGLLQTHVHQVLFSHSHFEPNSSWHRG